MTTFKIRTVKARHETPSLTVDEMHKKMVDQFKQQRTQLPRDKKKLVQLEKRLHDLEKTSNEFTNDDIHTRAVLKTTIEDMKAKIAEVESGRSEMEYYAKTDDILLRYYDILEEGDKDLPCTHAKEESESEDESILDKLNQQSQNTRLKKTTRRRKKKPGVSRSQNIMEFITDPPAVETDEVSQSRAEILREYRMMADQEYNPNDNKVDTTIIKCVDCDVDMMIIRTDGICVCPECAEVEMIITECERQNYQDALPDKPGYPYKRINHYNEWLSQFQAKESTEIDNEIYTKIVTELCKNRVKLKNLTLPYLKGVLKKLGLMSYYEKISQIISRLTGAPPPTITRDTEDILRKKFREIQEPFARHCPKERINFLSYAYVLHKFCQLMELDEFLKYFPLLKSRDKLRQQDKIWKMICLDLKWEFIPSI